MLSYHISTIGCQMNVADSERLGAALERLGCTPTEVLEEADVIVLNSCVVRQGAEDRAAGRLASLKPLKRRRPDKTIALMGCMVGPNTDELAARFPHADCFMRPQEYGDLLRLVEARVGACIDNSLPLIPNRPAVAAFVPISHGCDKFCAFCIIPYRRGRERSRPLQELVQEVEMLVQRGVREVTLLGQNVDSYGHDLPGRPDLADLLAAVNEVGGLRRVRFLTSHPNDMSQRIIDAVAGLDKVCDYINLPVQAGDDEVLQRMRRGYTREQYLELAGRIREAMPGVGLTTDVIVGFPGETEAQFQQTVDLVRQVRFDKVHVAMYSPRPGTIAWRKMEDDVPREEKRLRQAFVDEVQAEIALEINAALVGAREEVLVEGEKEGRWHGRTRANKLVHIESGERFQGEIVPVEITQASPYSLQGRVRRRARTVLPVAG